MCSTLENSGFWTPPPKWDARKRYSTAAATMPERKKCDVFHVIHKVPAGDSPYVRAKHVQLIDKDPSRAISMFWTAINAGDRVDSALKDMAVVMKQLNRSDEAIEAIKSFRHLCPFDAQDSLDNLLLELYKKSGRIDEEADLLERMLKNLEEGTTFGGKSMKTKRCQGKHIPITIEQEKARILGNLAWVHMQQHNYGIAEQHYRKALALEPDKNRQCNRVICLMHMGRIAEAKSQLQDVRDSLGSQWRYESYSKSFERAVEMLTEIESRDEHTIRRSNNSENSVSGYYGEKDSTSVPSGSNFSSDFHMETNSENFCATSCFVGGVKENQLPVTDAELGSVHKKTYAFPASVGRNSGGLFTQPRRCKWGFDYGDQRKGRLVGSSFRRLSFERDYNLKGEEQVTSSNESPENECKLDQSLIHGLHEFITGKTMPTQDWLMDKAKKSWADIVEEEEQEQRERV